MSQASLLVMDVQVGVVERVAGDAALVERVARAIAAARDGQVPVIYVRVAFRAGYPEASARNRTFSALAAAGEGYERRGAIDSARGSRP